MSRLVVSIVCILSVALASSFGQDKKASVANQETKGICSPITPDNRGTITITCTGFSERQNRQILDFLHQLSAEQAKDQDVLLQKLNEIIEALKSAERQAAPRTISEESQNMILKNNAWGICASVPIVVLAPSGDNEAIALAGQFRDLFRRAGRISKVDYSRVTGPERDKTDVIIAPDPMDVCVPSYLMRGGAPLHLAMKIDSRGCDGAILPQRKDNSPVTWVLVCPK
jgi:hypothetical protein